MTSINKFSDNSTSNNVEMDTTKRPRTDTVPVPHVEQALRYNEGKTRFSMLCWPALEGTSRVFMFGAKKYSENNWKKGIKYNVGMDSVMRHCIAFINNEDNDPESGLFHLYHAIASLMIVIWTYLMLDKNTFDDRYKPPSVPKTT